MAERCRAVDWAATPLGSVERWSVALRTVVGLVLGNGFPCILLWGPELVQLYNDGYVPFLGAKHPDGLGMPTHACWPELRDITAPVYARVLAGETVTLAEQRYALRRRGPDAPPDETVITLSYVPVRDPASGMDNGTSSDGAVRGIFVTLVDVTAQVAGRTAAAEREQLLAALDLERSRLTAVFQQSPSFLAVLRGPENTFEFVNDAYEQIVGRGRDVVGRALFDAIPEARGQGFDNYLGHVRRTGEPLVFRNLPVLLDRTPGAPQEERFIDITYLPLVEADGSHDAVIAHGVDVTDQVRAEQERTRLLAESEVARAAAEAANRSKSEFLAVMSHELRTPLNAIGGYAELIELGIRGPVTAEQRGDLEKIQRSQRHLLGLINGVLNYARIEAGAVHYELTDVVLDEVLTTCEALITPQVRAKGLTLRHAGCDQALRVRADRDKVQQIVLNLLSNAVKFTESGGEVALACARERAQVLVRVQDTGIGVPADQLARVFEPFVQIDATLTRTREGTGLGLAISRDLARGMGGDLTAESTPGVGSTFTLILPTP